MAIVAIDPGLTTGVVIATHNAGEIKILEAFEVAWKDRMRFPGFFARLAQGPLPVDAVVVESFRLFPHKFKHQVGSFFPSVRVIGVVETACYLAGLDNAIHFLEPIVKKHVKILDPAIARNPSEHIKDAYRLARYWAVKQ